jgi:proprotein convertase subtilisin/kexin type 5
VDGQYGDQILRRCLPCDSACATCLGSRQDQCLTCNAPYVFDAAAKKCQNDCSAGFYRSSGATAECLPCGTNCSSCVGSNTTCTSCTPPFALKSDIGVCVSKCPTGYYNETSVFGAYRCLRCHQNCFSCTGPAATQCSACVTGLMLKNSKCMSPCSIGTYSLGP